MQTAAYILIGLGAVLILIAFGGAVIKVAGIVYQRDPAAASSGVWAFLTGVILLAVGIFILTSHQEVLSGSASQGTNTQVIATGNGSGETTTPYNLGNGLTLTVHAVQSSNGEESGFYFSLSQPHAMDVKATFQCADSVTCGARSMHVAAGTSDHFIVNDPHYHNIPFNWQVTVYQ